MDKELSQTIDSNEVQGEKVWDVSNPVHQQSEQAGDQGYGETVGDSSQNSQTHKEEVDMSPSTVPPSIPDPSYNNSWKALTDTLKELVRIGLFALISGGVVLAAKYIGNLDPNSIWIPIGTYFLNSVDTFIHRNSNISASGLIGF